MAEAIAIVVSDLHPYTADLRADEVYAVVEVESDTDPYPHTARVITKGIRKGDRVRITYSISTYGVVSTYKIVEKILPT